MKACREGLSASDRPSCCLVIYWAIEKFQKRYIGLGIIDLTDHLTVRLVVSLSSKTVLWVLTLKILIAISSQDAPCLLCTLR